MGRVRRAERGQVLPVAAAMMAVLIAFAGIAVDIGRLWAERRFLQNAADAGALAGCDALIDGASDDTARTTAITVGNLNLANSPAGTTPVLDASTLRYEPGHAGDPSYLTHGVLVSSDGEVRVAIHSEIDTVLARVLGVLDLEIGARAMCRTIGMPQIPLVARRYERNRGQGRGNPSGGFVDNMATKQTSKDGDVDQYDIVGYDVRTPASEASPGPEFWLYGPQSRASNANWFHGFVAFDIRNYLTNTSRVYYNGVPPGTNPSTIKNSQGAYILNGYPGPEFPPVTSPPNPLDQVAAITGLNTPQTVGNFNARYNTGDIVMAPVYSGTVMEVADFAVDVPGMIDVDEDDLTNAGPTVNLTVIRDRNFNFNVNLTLLGDNNAQYATPSHPEYDLIDEPLAPSNPADGRMTAEFSINNFLPDSRRGTKVQLRNFSTNDLEEGIYTIWLRADAGTPVYRRHDYPVPVRVGGAVRDFNLDNSILSGVVATAGEVLTLPLYVETVSGSTDYTGGGNRETDVTLSVDANSLPAGMAPSQVSFSDNTVMPAPDPGAATTLTINTAGVAPGIHTLHLRATGTNGAGQPVTHIEVIEIGVGVNPGDKKYVDIIGFGLFEVLDIRSNSIRVRAVSRVYADPNDPGLQRDQQARLVPWD